ncbi:MAG: glycoside hydrolase [Anaerolineae bacterium]|nr:glycoside hydrolase [Anaerolineae bacterium]
MAFEKMTYQKDGMELYLATSEGFVTAVAQNNEWQVTRRSLPGVNATSIMAREGVILLGSTDGVWMSEDGGETWQERSQGLAHRHVRWLAYHPEVSDFELAGTEPAAIFISRDGGANWHARTHIEDLRDQFGWWLPYSPGAGCVRGFAVNGYRLYAAVEVGGLLRSDDAGETWALAAGSDGRPKFGRPKPQHIHPDVHSVESHPSSPDLVFAPTGGGFYASVDGGMTWECRYDNCYVRAVWADPADANHLILGPSEGPDGRHGRIEQSHDGGKSWRRLTQPQPYNMVERFYQAGESLLAVMANGDLWAAHLAEQNWQPILADVTSINAVAHMGSA